MINPKRTTQRSVMQQHNVSHNTVAVAQPAQKFGVGQKIWEGQNV